MDESNCISGAENTEERPSKHKCTAINPLTTTRSTLKGKSITMLTSTHTMLSLSLWVSLALTSLWDNATGIDFFRFLFSSISLGRTVMWRTKSMLLHYLDEWPKKSRWLIFFLWEWIKHRTAISRHRLALCSFFLSKRGIHKREAQRCSGDTVISVLNYRLAHGSHSHMCLCYSEWHISLKGMSAITSRSFNLRNSFLVSV